ncbi:MAG: M28 family peptidase [Bacteroidales bacterium]|nr:M28 family peptidase [Bacteroidales bacterium]
MKKALLFLSGLIIAASSVAQFNITVTNPEAIEVLKGNYDPATYMPGMVINDPDSILLGVVSRVSGDTMIAYLQHIDTYFNRNTGSDTISETRGIGAVRRWIHKKFMEYRASSEGRLVVTYNQFQQNVCGQAWHRNVLAILPGLDTTNKEIMIVQGHFDTRCQNGCDTSCYTPGMEDNGSGTVLVMELARIMSRYAFDHTIVFACLTGEDQGLYGAKAFSRWILDNEIPVRSVFNNDVIGGIACGMTSSPPSCPYFNHIDSTHVRLFSYSVSNDSARVSAHKQLGRYIVMHQEELINPLLETPMTINLIISEDRTGRSGDHIPFRQKGYTAIRFCSQNEHGNGAGTPPDRQHTSDDILGLDLSIPPDGIIDSFFVDPGYLRRNTIMNGVNLGWLAIAPPSPDPDFVFTGDAMEINLTGADSLYQHYRVGLRMKGSGSLNFDTVYTYTGTNHLLIEGLDPNKTYYFSVANVLNGVESLFCDEFSLYPVGIEGYMLKEWGVILHQNRPNPFLTKTEIVIEVTREPANSRAEIIITEMTGRVISRIPVELQPGMNSVEFSPPPGIHGLLTFSLSLNGVIAATRKMSVL